MTPFVWASTRRISGAFLKGTRLERSKNSFEAAASARDRGLKGGFAMFEGGYPVSTKRRLIAWLIGYLTFVVVTRGQTSRQCFVIR